MPSTPPAAPNQPYCANCGYLLTGLTDSSKCPECGKPIVEVLARPAWMPNFGKRYRSKATLFGWPVLNVAIGPRDGEMRGHARGIIAVGDIATGAIAIGGLARGIVCVGGMAVGVISIAGLSVGLLAAIGGFAMAILANGGMAVGVLASGGMALGFLAQGGGALGLHARSASTRTIAHPSPFDQFHWFFGRFPPHSAIDILRPILIISALAAAVAALICFVALLKYIASPSDAADQR